MRAAGFKERYILTKSGFEAIGLDDQKKEEKALQGFLFLFHNVVSYDTDNYGDKVTAVAYYACNGTDIVIVAYPANTGDRQHDPHLFHVGGAVG